MHFYILLYLIHFINKMAQLVHTSRVFNEHLLIALISCVTNRFWFASHYLFKFGTLQWYQSMILAQLWVTSKIMGDLVMYAQ